MGGEVLGLEAAASLELTFGDEDMKRMAQAASGLVVPVAFWGVGSGTQTKRTDPASNVDYIRLACHQNVPADSYWEVRSLRISKNGTPFQAGAGEAAYLFGGDSGDDYTIGSWEDVGLAVPSVTFYSAGQLVLFPGARVYLAITNYDSTAQTTYQVRGLAQQRPYGGGVLPVAAT